MLGNVSVAALLVGAWWTVGPSLLVLPLDLVTCPVVQPVETRQQVTWVVVTAFVEGPGNTGIACASGIVALLLLGFAWWVSAVLAGTTTSIVHGSFAFVGGETYAQSTHQ